MKVVTSNIYSHKYDFFIYPFGSHFNSRSLRDRARCKTPKKYNFLHSLGTLLECQIQPILSETYILLNFNLPSLSSNTYSNTFTIIGQSEAQHKIRNHQYRIGCVSTRFGLLHALAYYAQHNCDFIMTINMRFGLLRAFGL